MKKYFNTTLLFTILITGCVKNNNIDFTSSETFFSSLNNAKITQKKSKKPTSLSSPNNAKITQKKSKKPTAPMNSSKRNKIDDENKSKIKKFFLLNLTYYKKVLKQKFGFDEYNILKNFSRPSLKIKHGKIKNFQFHLNSCHLDLFFLYENGTYRFRHFDIRPSSVSSSLNEEECAKELNSTFNLIHDLK